MWVDVVHAWAAEQQRWVFVLEDCPVFENKNIARKLSREGMEVSILRQSAATASIQAVAVALVSDGRAERISSGRLQLYPQRPSQLANSLYEWLSQSAMLHSVYTVFELHDESAASQDNPYVREISPLASSWLPDAAESTPRSSARSSAS